MYIYELRNTFDRYTGKQNEPELVATSKIICDYTGIEVTERGIEYTPYDIGGSEEWYYYEEFIVNDKMVDMYEFMHKQPGFHYIDNDKLILLMSEHINSRDKTFLQPNTLTPLQKDLKKSGYGDLLKDAYSFAHAMLDARIRVINKLIKEGADPSMFGITFEED